MDTTSPPARYSGRSIGLRNWRVRSKLIAVLVIPAIASLVLASFGIGSLVGNPQTYEDGRRLAGLGRQVTVLVQAERDFTGAFTFSGNENVGRALSQQQSRANQTAGAYREVEAPLYEHLGDRLRGRFDAVRAGLDDWAALHEPARSSSLTRRAIAAEYLRNIDQLLDVNADIAGPGGDEDLSQAVRFFNDLSRAKEVASYVGADSLGYLSLEAQTETAAGPGQGPGGLCTACFTGTYPIPIHAAAGPALGLSATTQLPTLPLPNPEPEVAR